MKINPQIVDAALLKLPEIVTRLTQRFIRIDSSQVIERNLFTKGEFLRAYVDSTARDGSFVLSIKGEKITAAAKNVQLSKGDFVSVVVERLRPFITLKILTPAQASQVFKAQVFSALFPESSVELLGDIPANRFTALLDLINQLAAQTGPNSPIKSDLEILQSLFGFANAEAGLDGEKIRQIIRAFNMPITDLIAELAHLAQAEDKSLIAAIIGDSKFLRSLYFESSNEFAESKSILSGEQQSLLSRLTSTFGDLLERLARHHVANTLSYLENDTFELMIPLIVENEFALHKLSVFGGNQMKSGKKQKALNIILNLDLSALGEVNVYAYVTKQTIAVNVTVSDESVCETIRSDIPELRHSLVDKGFNVEEIVCNYKPNTPNSSNAKRSPANQYRKINIEI